jgi:hypothetical protein
MKTGTPGGVRSVGFAAILAALCCSTIACDSTIFGGKDKDEDAADDKKDKKKKDKKGKEGFKSDGPGDVDPGQGGVPEAESYIADNGFRPARNGFPWPNGDRDDATGQSKEYPSSSKGHLDVDGMQRLFTSPKVCASMNPCVLTPGAEQFMDRVNRSMNGGQCEGLAVFTLSLYKGLDKPATFSPGADAASALARDQVRGPVGYYFSYQFLEPFRSYLYGTMERGSPAEVLDTVVAALKSDDPVSLEFLQPGVGGHAVVPYAVEDRGNDVFWIRIWDNNYPNVSRYIEIDKNQNTWSYAGASINPGEQAGRWGGSAASNTIVATLLSKRMYDAVCPFCTGADSRMIMVSGGGSALITDNDGKRIGRVGDSWVNEIPGAEMRHLFAYVPGQKPPEPVYILPNNAELKVAVEGDSDGAGLAVFGSGTTFSMDDVATGGGQRDSFGLAADGHSFSYEPSEGGRKPRAVISVDGGDNDYQLDMSSFDIAGGKGLTFSLDTDSLQLKVEEGGEQVDDFDIKITKVDSKGEKKVFSKSDIPESKGLTGSGGLNFGDL